MIGTHDYCRSSDNRRGRLLIRPEVSVCSSPSSHHPEFFHINICSVYYPSHTFTSTSSIGRPVPLHSSQHKHHGSKFPDQPSEYTTITIPSTSRSAKWQQQQTPENSGSAATDSAAVDKHHLIAVSAHTLLPTPINHANSDCRRIWPEGHLRLLRPQ